MIASFPSGVSLEALLPSVALAVALTIAPTTASRAEEPSPMAASPSAAANPAGPLFWDPRDRPTRPETEVTAIRFLTAGDFPPFDFLDSSGRLTGYHVDLARRICRELKADCTIQMRPFGDLITALTDKRGDAVIAGLRVDGDLRERFDTTDAYLTTPARFVTRRGTAITVTPEGLAGHWVSAVSGSAHEAFLLATFPGIRLAAYPDETAARDALRDGRVEAHFGDAIALSFWLSGSASRDCCDFDGGPWLESTFFGEGLRIVVPRANYRLKANLDYALRKLAVDGQLSELYLRWFPRSYY